MTPLSWPSVPQLGPRKLFGLFPRSEPQEPGEGREGTQTWARKESRVGGREWASGPVASLTWASRQRLGGPGARPEGQPGSHPPPPGHYPTSPDLTSCLREIHTEQLSGVLFSPVFLPTPKGCNPPGSELSLPAVPRNHLYFPQIPGWFSFSHLSSG